MKTNIMALAAATIAMFMTSVTTIKAEASAKNSAPDSPTVIEEVVNYRKTYDFYYTTARGDNNRFEYTVDKRGRVTSKVLYRQADNGNWTPRCIWKATYGDTTNILTFAGWDNRKGEFSLNVRSVSYPTAEHPILIALPE